MTKAQRDPKITTHYVQALKITIEKMWDGSSDSNKLCTLVYLSLLEQRVRKRGVRKLVKSSIDCRVHDGSHEKKTGENCLR